MARQKGIIVPISATDNTARAFESVQAQVAALRAKVSSLQGQLSGGEPGETLARGMGHATPQIAAASGAIRELEGNLPIRAVERFLTTTLGLGPALGAIFPLIGAVAFFGVISEGVKKLIEMREAGRNAGADISRAFSEFNGKLDTTNDELALTNAKLQDQIDILSKHPNNGLQTALYDARVEADKLKESLDGDIRQLESLLQQREVGSLAALVSGVASNKGADREVSDVGKGVEKQNAAALKTYDEALAAAGQDEEKRAAATRAYYSKVAENSAEAARHLRGRAAEIARQQKVADDTAAELRGRGFRAANPVDLTPERATFEDSAETYDRLQRNAQLSGTNVQLKTQKDKLEGTKHSDDAAKKAEEEARKAREANDKLAAAQRGFDDATAREAAAGAKAETEAKLAGLEQQHKALLLSDEEYFQQKTSAQNAALEAERAALTTQQRDLQGQVSRLQGQKLTGNDAVDRDAKVLDLKAKIVGLDGQSAKLTGDQARNTALQADALQELTRRRTADADKLAAQLEVERGGSVSARQGQSRDEYLRRRQELTAEYGSDQAPVIGNLDQQQIIDQDAIAARGSEQDLGVGDAGRAAQRADVEDRLRRGQVSAQEAQRQKIDLDREEASALAPVLAAYEKLANDGDVTAMEKVISLKRRIGELSEPVNEVAAEVRGQLDSAFEHVFENIDKGKKGLQEFARMLQSDLLKDLYKNSVEPGLQAALGILIPNGKGSASPSAGGVAGLPQASGKGGFGAAFGRILSGAGGDAGTKGGGVKITIINETSTPVTASQTSSGSSGSDLEDSIVHIVLKNATEGGALSHLFA